MIHVFRTSVETDEHVQRVGAALSNELVQGAEWNFDLEDCDHILRVTNGCSETASRCRRALELNGFTCEELTD